MADQYIAMGNCHASLTGWCQQKPGDAEWLNTFDGSLFTRSWRGWKREGISKFHWCGKNTLAEGTSFMFYMNGWFLRFPFSTKKWLVKKLRSPRLWFLWAVLVSLMWCYFAVTTTCQVVKVLCQNGVTMETSMREERSLSGILEIVGSACNMVLELQGRCQLADNGTMWFANFWNCHSGLGFGICCP